MGVNPGMSNMATMASKFQQHLISKDLDKYYVQK